MVPGNTVREGFGLLQSLRCNSETLQGMGLSQNRFKAIQAQKQEPKTTNLQKTNKENKRKKGWSKIHPFLR